MPTATAYHLDAAATPHPQASLPAMSLVPPARLDAQARLVQDLVSLATVSSGAEPVAVEVARHGPQLEVTLRRAGLVLELPRVEPVARAHRVAVASAYGAQGVVRLALLLPAMGFAP